MEPRSYLLGEVFVPGGLPTVTYVPRTALGLEERVSDYLAERHKILSLSGPTKCGKTVLLKSALAPHGSYWVSGGEIESIESLWSILADQLNISSEEQSGERKSKAETGESVVEGGIKPGGIGVGGSTKAGHAAISEQQTSTKRVKNPGAAVRAALLAESRPLVIDDFHYIHPDVQLQIVRALKDTVFQGLPVIIASVPHRAFDAVRVEKEMTGRVEQLPISFWSQDELATIAVDGFDALAVDDPDNLAGRLTTEAFSSPHLMQDFCLQLCKVNDVRQTQIVRRDLTAPDWTDFYRSRASNASKAAFDLLARGPRQRSDRIERHLHTGEVTDIYGAVLRAIAATGPLTELKYEELRASLKEVLASEPPQRHEVTRILEEMTKIARTDMEGEPVVDYDAELGILFISDPFFAYYLRWAARP